MKATYLCSLLLAVALAACGGQQPDGAAPESADSLEAREDLTEGIRETLDQALVSQKKVLEETAALVASPEGASVEDIEAALGTLNRSLIEGRQAVAALRTQDIPGKKALMKELRESNARVREAYDALVPSHPDPGSLPALVLEDEAGQ